MSTLFPVSPELAQSSQIDAKKYADWYEQSIKDPNGFWGEHGKRLDWIKPYTKVRDVSFTGDVHIRWYEDGTLNVAANCLDRHLATKGRQDAIIWEGDDPNEIARTSPTGSCTNEVCRFANVLADLGVKKGDRVTIYLPMIPEAAVAMLACARIGAIHSVVFGGFSPDAPGAAASRIAARTWSSPRTKACAAARKVPLKANVDVALETCWSVKNVVVVKRTGGDVHMVEGRDHWYHELVADGLATCEPAEMNAEDPLFILYTSGSTGKPKGVLHTTGGYLVYAAMTHQIRLRLSRRRRLLVHRRRRLGHRPQLHRLRPAGQRRHHADVRGRADLSRRQPLLAGDRQAQGHDLLHRAHRHPRPDARGRGAGQDRLAASRLRLLGSVGEPINPEAWLWYHRVVGDERCPIVDTWWQTETGGILITPLPGAIAAEARLGHPAVLRRQAGAGRRRRQGAARARPRAICASPMPGPARCARSTATTSASSRPISPPIQGMYFTGDGCRARRGRLLLDHRPRRRRDQRLRPPHGHRRGRDRRWSPIPRWPRRRWSAIPHDIKGQGIYAYVTLMAGDEPSEDLRKELVAWVRQRDRPDRQARPDPVGAGPAQDPLRQDHAPHPAQDRRERVRAAWATPRPWRIPRWSIS